MLKNTTKHVTTAAGHGSARCMARKEPQKHYHDFQHHQAGVRF